jgi:ketosteroid isomerase-like protein
MKAIGLLLVAALALPARAQTALTPSDSLPSVKLPAELDRVLRDYERLWKAGDAAALVMLFTEDGFVMQPNKPPVRGREAMKRVYTGQGGGALKLRALAFAHSDTVGYIIGAYGYGDAPGDMGKFTLTLRKERGKWLIASDMDNGSRAPTRPPG